jgi:hypothetical protein
MGADAGSGRSFRVRVHVAALTGAVMACASMLVPGCAQGARGEPFRPTFVSGDDSVIYVFREPGAFNGSVLRVYINQEYIASLRTGEYLAQVEPPGEYLVRVEGVSSIVSRVIFIGGEAAYLQIDAPGYNPKPWVRVVGSEEGVEMISKTALAPRAGSNSQPDH